MYKIRDCLYSSFEDEKQLKLKFDQTIKKKCRYNARKCSN